MECLHNEIVNILNIRIFIAVFNGLTESPFAGKK